MNNISDVKDRIMEHISIANRMIELQPTLQTVCDISDVIVQSLKTGGKLLICGNGGSAADSQHLEAEFISRFYKERQAFYAEALTVNTSSITAIGNDYSYIDVFARQVEAKGHDGDVLLGISTSGSSKNVLLALKQAKKQKIVTIGYTGSKVCEMDSLCDYIIHVPSEDTPRIQEMHILIGHIMCEWVEKRLACSEKSNSFE